MNKVIIFGFILFNIALFCGVGAAFAQEHLEMNEYLTDFRAIAAAIAIGVAAAGGAFAQGRAGAAALDSIGRNPEASKAIFTPMILILALIESLVIFALVIALRLANFFTV